MKDLIGVFDDQLVEEDYEDIREKEFSKKQMLVAWFTDKYWITTLIPEKIRILEQISILKINLEQTLLRLNPYELSPNGTVSSNVRVIVAAKEVDVIDGYAENSKIAKFDLAIDWGWFYFLYKNWFICNRLFF